LHRIAELPPLITSPHLRKPCALFAKKVRKRTGFYVANM
jgi:hypothetical protein